MYPQSKIGPPQELSSNQIIKAYTELMKQLAMNRAAYDLKDAVNVNGDSAVRPVVTKSPGLKKWKRIPRDLVKKTGSELDDSGGYLEWNVSLIPKGVVNVDGDSVVRPGFGTRSDSDESSRSENGGGDPRMRNEVCDLNGEDSGLFDDQRRNGRDGPGKKARGFIIEKENENSDTATRSDSQSSNFVFVQGSSNNVESEGRESGVFAKYDEESSDDAHYADKHLKEEAQSDAQSDDKSDVSLAADDIEKHEGSIDEDQLVESIKGLHLAQVEFETEVQNWRDVGKEDDPLHEILEVKDSKILELETILNSGDIKTKLEDRLMKLIQTEVEYVVLSTTSKLLTEGPLREIKHDDLQQKNVSLQEKQDEKLQTKDLKKLQSKVCKFTSCFIIMLTLLLVTIYLQFSPQNVEVVPT